MSIRLLNMPWGFSSDFICSSPPVVFPGKPFVGISMKSGYARRTATDPFYHLRTYRCCVRPGIKRRLPPYWSSLSGSPSRNMPGPYCPTDRDLMYCSPLGGPCSRFSQVVSYADQVKENITRILPSDRCIASSPIAQHYHDYCIFNVTSNYDDLILLLSLAL